MPGHMNVLLAEANVPYENLHEMDDVNPIMENIDVCIVIGANDVVNPAAREEENSPIYGMPVINVDQAKTVVVLKRGWLLVLQVFKIPCFLKIILVCCLATLSVYKDLCLNLSNKTRG